MSNSGSDWHTAGRGVTPMKSWSFAADADLVSLQLARETGDTLVGDASGGVYLLDRGGRVITMTRGFHHLNDLALSDTGGIGAAVLGETRLCRFNRQLEVQWSLELPDAILAVAVDPFGHHIGVSLADCSNWVFDATKKRVARFHTIRPLSFLSFLVNEAGMLGAAEYGLLCCHQLNGDEIWNEKLWSNVGGMCVTGDGLAAFLACFSHGVQMFDSEGTSHSTYVVEGTPNRVATSFVAHRVVVSTVERSLYWLDSDGEMLWAAGLPDDVCNICCDPLGGGLICGFQSGQVLRFDWDTPAGG